MPKIITEDSIVSAIVLEGQRARFDEGGSLAKTVSDTYLSHRLDEKWANVSYYNRFLSQQPSIGYEHGTLSLKRSDRVILYTDSSAELPVKGIYEITSAEFLEATTYKDSFFWMLAGTSAWLPEEGPINIFIMFNMILPVFHTLSLKSDITEVSTPFSLSAIEEAFNRNIYVYLTTETGTVKLQSYSQLNIEQVYGEDDVFSQRYVTLSTQDFFPE